MRPHRFGEITVSKVVELEGLSFKPGFLLPDVTSPEVLTPHLHWLEPGYYNRQHDRFIMSMHTYVVRTRHHTILIDSCIGNHKPRPGRPSWNMKTDDSYLRGLASAGFSVVPKRSTATAHASFTRLKRSIGASSGRRRSTRSRSWPS